MTLQQRLEKDGWAGIEPILFYSKKDEWNEFSNFSYHSVTLPNPWTREIVTYRTGEHRYQALKAANEDDHDWVFEANRPTEAKDRGRVVSLLDGWGNSYNSLCYWVMKETALAKAIQHQDVYDRLVDSVGRPIYENSPTDDIWGIRYAQSYNGKNLLGRAWMEVRQLLV